MPLQHTRLRWIPAFAGMTELKYKSTFNNKLMIHLPPSRPIAGSPAAIYLASLAPRSQRVMGDNLQRVAAWISDGRDDAYTLLWHLLDKSTFIAAQKYFSRQYSAAKVNQMMYAVKGVLKASRQVGLISRERYGDTVDFEMLQERPSPKGRLITVEEIGRLLACCDDGTIKGTRDAAILAVLRGCGLKRSEVANLTMDHYDAVTGTITVIGATKQSRSIVIDADSRIRMNTWIAIRGKEEGHIFYPITKSGKIKRHAMRDQSILDIVMERGEQAGIKHISPHDFRYTFALEQINSGADLAVVSRKMGHTNIVTTQKYTSK